MRLLPYEKNFQNASMLPQESVILESLPHLKREDLAAAAGLDCSSPVGALVQAELHEQEDLDGSLLHQALSKATDPRAHAYLLSKTLARQEARSGADQAFHQGLQRLEQLCVHLGQKRFALLPLRLKLKHAQAHGDLHTAQEILLQAQDLLTTEPVDSDPQLEWAMHQALLFAHQGAWLALDNLLERLNPFREKLLHRVGFNLEVHQLECLLKTWRLDEVLERSQAYHRSPSIAVLRARALAWKGDHRAAQDIIHEYRDQVPYIEQLLAHWDLACARGSTDELMSVCEAYLAISEHRNRDLCLAESALLRGRLQQARLAIRHCGAEADSMRMRIALKTGNMAEAVPYAQAIIQQAGQGGLLAILHEAWESAGPILLDLWLAVGEPSAPARRFPQQPPPQPSADALQSLVGSSPVMQGLRQQIQRIAQRPEPVLIIGETGTGKELVAHALHELGRASKPFIAVNCSGLPESLAETTLFGHRKGSFTGAHDHHQGLIHLAQDGILFLDEIDSMPLSMQGLLLRLLESGDYWPVGASQPRKLKARIIAACQQPLEEAVRAGRCREDLRYRLERLTLAIPPLREHSSDIPDLFKHFCRDMGETPPSLTALTRAQWQKALWPGNVRELRNAVERYVILGDTAMPPSGKPGPTPETLPGRPQMNEITKSVTGSLGPPKAARRRRAILDLCKRHPEISRKLVSEQLNCAPKTAAEDLRHLESIGHLQRVCEGPTRLHYFILRQV